MSSLYYPYMEEITFVFDRLTRVSGRVVAIVNDSEGQSHELTLTEFRARFGESAHGVNYGQVIYLTTMWRTKQLLN